jgi:hypothetical protein
VPGHACRRRGATRTTRPGGVRRGDCARLSRSTARGALRERGRRAIRRFVHVPP